MSRESLSKTFRVGTCSMFASTARDRRHRRRDRARRQCKPAAAYASRPRGEGARAPARTPFSSSRRSPRRAWASAGQYGEGALLKGGKAAAYYSTAGASVGLQAGAQTFGYALFFMNANALAQLDKADGFEVGVGPTVVVMDEGKAKTMTTTTAKDDIYAFIFGQKGLMAGIGVQGNKITKITPK
jgi:hypothetical protein